MPIKEQLILEGVNRTGGAFNSVQRSLKRVEKNTTNLDKGFGNLKRNILGVAAALGGFSAVRGIVDVTARFEDLRTSLASVSGGAEQGAEAFDFISRFATKTQFGVEELSQTFIKLKAAGIEPTEKLLTTFTDTAAVTTDQLGSLTAITDLLARTTSGGLGLEELNRLADRGIPVFRILEEQLGLTRLQISEFGKTAEGAEKITQALLSGLDKSFGGATAARAQNLSTRISNLQIAIANASDSLGQGFNVALGETIVKITELIEDNDEFIRQIGVELGEGIKVASEAAADLKEPMIAIGGVLGDMINGYNQLPAEVKAAGLIGVVLFGKKGIAALAAISIAMDKIQEQYSKLVNTPLPVPDTAEAIRKQINELKKEILAIEDVANMNIPKFEIDLSIAELDPTLVSEDIQAKLDQIATLEEALADILEEQAKAAHNARFGIVALTKEQTTSSEATKTQTDSVHELLKPYKEWIDLSDKYAKMDTGTPIEKATQKMLQAEITIEKLKEAQSKLNLFSATSNELNDVAVEKYKQLGIQIDHATRMQQHYAEQLKTLQDEKALQDSEAAEREIYGGMTYQEYLASQREKFQTLEDALRSEEEVVYDTYRERQALIDYALNKQLITHDRYSQLIAKVEQQKNDALIDIEKRTQEEILKIKEDALREELKMRGVNDRDIQKRLELEKATRFEQGQAILDNTVNIFKALGQENKKAFQAYKAFAIAQAIIDSISAAQSAFKAMIGIPVVGPVLAYTAAGAALAAGYARVSAIRSQTYGGRREGGPVTGGSPFLVGEDQPEVFTPRTNGDITPLDELMNKQSEPVQVVFQIQANDTAGFDDLIKKRRGLIVNIINDAVMNKGKEAIV